MKDISITVPVVCYGYDELPDDAVRALVEKARQSTYHSYAPYSHFCVGAAILLDNGETITGANQENAAFSAGTCAGTEGGIFLIGTRDGLAVVQQDGGADTEVAVRCIRMIGGLAGLFHEGADGIVRQFIVAVADYGDSDTDVFHCVCREETVVVIGFWPRPRQ